MTLETDADRLGYLEAFGVCIRTDRGEFWAIFDDEGTEIDVDGVRVRSTSPQITARACDLERLGLNSRGARLSRGDVNYTVRELAPDGTGMTAVILDEE